MKKETPRVFANKVDKTFNNNSTYAVTRNDERTAIKEKRIDNRNIRQKINDIFKSSNYIYKADVNIEINGRTIKKRIIGMKNNQLITMDNELISVSDITDIYYD